MPILLSVGLTGAVVLLLDAQPAGGPASWLPGSSEARGEGAGRTGSAPRPLADLAPWTSADEPAQAGPSGVATAALPERAPGEIAPSGGAAADQPFEAAPENEAPSVLDCLIEPFELIEVGSSVVGIIETVLVERSDFVEAGQVVVLLESAAERAGVELARERALAQGEVKSQEANLALTERKRQRARKLYEGDALSAELRDELETEAEVARRQLQRAREEKSLAALQLQQAEALLERRTIRSPVSGVVVDRLLSPGERVDEEAILRIARIDPLRVEVILPSALYGTLQPGTPAAVTPELPGDRVHVASVELVDRMIDAASGTFGARLQLPNPEQSIPAGQRCEVRFLHEDE
jgi:RND family efflux transporter MFP subunit